MGIAGQRRAVVVGCGVSGLSCAVRLAEAGFEVEVWGREPPERTTSVVAAALWYPFLVGPGDRVARWSRQSLEEFRRLAAVEGSGVVLCPGLELVPPGAPPEPWRSGIEDLRRVPPSELPRRDREGFAWTAPVVEMPIYLPWLRRRVAALGARLVQREVRSLDEALAAAPLVVHCAGMGARELAADRSLRPVRGQVVRVERSGVERFTLDDHDPAGVSYVVPRSADCVLGGSADEGREDLLPDEHTTRAILARCRALVPELAEARVMSVSVGLRPVRPEVRVEAERVGGGLVIHDYGHGGAGVTLSWGCAAEVARLAGASGAEQELRGQQHEQE